jgi:hypothetical protein
MIIINDNDIDQIFSEININDDDLQLDNNKKRPHRPTRAAKKEIRYQKKLLQLKDLKLEKKILSQNENEKVLKNENDKPKIYPENSVYLNKRILKQRAHNRLLEAYQPDQSKKRLQICIDCSFSSIMSNKEMVHLAQQIGLCYASNKALTSPIQLSLCNLSRVCVFNSFLFIIFNVISIHSFKNRLQNFIKNLKELIMVLVIIF